MDSIRMVLVSTMWIFGTHGCRFVKFPGKRLPNPPPGDSSSAMVRGTAGCLKLCVDSLECLGVNLILDTRERAFVCETFGELPVGLTSQALSKNHGGMFAMKDQVDLGTMYPLSCDAQTSYNANFGCDKALDGDPNTQWSCSNNDADTFTVYLPPTGVVLTRLELLVRCSMFDQSPTLAIGIGGLPETQYNRTCSTSTSPSYCVGQTAEVYVVGPVVADQVTVTPVGRCDETFQGYTGLRELRVFGFIL